MPNLGTSHANFLGQAISWSTGFCLLAQIAFVCVEKNDAYLIINSCVPLALVEVLGKFGYGV